MRQPIVITITTSIKSQPVTKSYVVPSFYGKRLYNHLLSHIIHIFQHKRRTILAT